MRSLHRWLIALLGACLQLNGAHGATVQPPGAQMMMDALARANAAVVGIKVTAADGARSAETLGQRRAGSGVVIAPDGLILT
ncbi:MAG: serine protease, partial [Pseudomonadota bacterium]|nr:serine protease [Pseudomonadota bacterium]